MIYLIYGEEEVLIARKIAQILADPEDYELVKIDASGKDFSLAALIEHLRSVSIFSARQKILVYNPLFLKNKYEEKDLEGLFAYLQDPVYENDLVFIDKGIGFNSRLKCFKKISENAEVTYCKAIDRRQFPAVCYQEIADSGLQIDQKTVDLLVNASDLNLSLFVSYLDILKNYPDKIDQNVINGLFDFENVDVFDLINALTHRRLSEALSYSKLLMAKNDSPLPVMAALSNQLHFLYSVSYYSSLGYSNSSIMEKLGIHKEFRLKKAFEALEYLDRDSILSLLSSLCLLDHQIKTNGQIDPKLSFELYILNLAGGFYA